MKQIILIISLASLLSFAGDWTQYQRDAGHTGACADSLGPAIRSGRFGKAAEVPLAAGPIWASPVLRGDTIYVGAHDRRFYAVDANDIRRTYWSVNLGGKVHGSAAVARNHILTGCSNGTVYLINLNGTLADSFLTSSGLYGKNEKEIFADVTWSDESGHFYLGNGAGFFYAFKVTGNDLDTAWSFRVPSTTHYAPAIYTGAAYGDSFVYVPNGDSRVWKLKDLGDSYTVTDSSYCYGDDRLHGNAIIANTLTLYNGRLFFGRLETELAIFWAGLPVDSLGAQFGERNGGSLDGGAAPIGSFAAADGYIYIPTVRGKTLCKDAATLLNRTGWTDTRYSALYEMSSEAGLALSADYVVEVGNGGTLRLTPKSSDASAGVAIKPWADPAWAAHEKMSKSAPAISNGRIYFGCNKGYLFAYGDSVNFTSGSIAIPTLSAPDPLSIHPNPFSRNVSIRVAAVDPSTTLRIFDVRGSLLADLSAALAKHGSVRWNTERLPPGLYMSEVRNRTGRTVRSMLLIR